MIKRIGPDLGGLHLPGPAEKAVYGALALRDEQAPAVTDRKGKPESDPDLRDYENVPLPAVALNYASDPSDRMNRLEFRSAISDYVKAEVLPHVPDAWVDTDKTKIGYEIPLTRHFYRYVPPRPVAEIDAEIGALEVEIKRLLANNTQ
jgi:type I restriction enzyme M protein